MRLNFHYHTVGMLFVGHKIVGGAKEFAHFKRNCLAIFILTWRGTIGFVQVRIMSGDSGLNILRLFTIIHQIMNSSATIHKLNAKVEVDGTVSANFFGTIITGMDVEVYELS